MFFSFRNQSINRDIKRYSVSLNPRRSKTFSASFWQKEKGSAEPLPISSAQCRIIKDKASLIRINSL